MAIAIALVVLGAGAGSAAAAEAPVLGRRPERLLILSVPTFTWGDLTEGRAPNLRRLLRGSAVAGLITRAGGHRTSIGNSYLSLGSGAAATGDELRVGEAYSTDEEYRGATAADAFARRTGTDATSGIVHLAIEQLVAENHASVYDPDLGALGDALRKAGYTRAVVANADGSEPWTVDTPIPPRQRAAATALMGADGTVPEGRVDTGLLDHDADAPFGLRLDPDAVEQTFVESWNPGSVVLVEASDLLRADIYTRFATEAQARRLVRDAIERTDALIGRLLEHVDPERDAVIVTGTSGSTTRKGLTLFGVDAPGGETGLLRSPTTRRTGFVQLLDIAPTTLRLLGVDIPEAMKGRPMQVRRTATTAESRERLLVDANRDGVFRDDHVDVVRRGIIAIAAALGLGAAFVVLRARRGAALLEWLALTFLGFLIATHLAAPFHFARHGGFGIYLAFSIGVGGLLAAAALALGRRRPYDPLLALLGVIVGVHLVDLGSGARLQLNTMLGYSSTNGIRLVGQGNITFAVLGSAVVLLAGLVVWRERAPWATRAVIALLAVTLALMASPAWGQDFGAAVAGAPAFAMLAWLLLGHDLRPRGVLALGAVVVASGALFGTLDLLRPADQRTHVGRFFERIGNEGLGGVLEVVRRKADTNIHSFTNSILAWLLPITLAALVGLWYARSSGLRALVLHERTLRVTLWSLLVFALLGYALNDSGIAIPAMVALVAECAAVFVAARHVRRPELVPAEPARRPMRVRPASEATRAPSPAVAPEAGRWVR